ncbi:MAG TPA: alpha-mannosidase [Candidatus Blautia merdipullorum]|nr:alpha-mannosidase [Candidatus Blautia merdipullorum]
MFLTERKLDRRIAEIREYCYREIRHLEEFAVCEDHQGVVNPEVPVEFEGWEKMRTGERWSGRDRYLWLHKEITIPESWKGKRAVGIFDFGNTGAGNNSGFEAMCYINEKPYQGVDVNHKEVFFPEELYGKPFRLTFRLWSGLEGGGVPRIQEHRINRADLGYLDEKADDFYYLSMLMLDTVQCLDEKDPVKYELRTALDQACLLIDWAYPGSGEFYDSLHQADDFLNEKINGMKKDSLVKVKCVGHTHIDMAWLWRLKHTHEKASRSFSTVLRMMEMFPEYIFLQTQPQLYEYIKEDFPEIYEEIKKRIKEGRWEVDGGMWVEADCNLTSGESLTRQILIGSKFIKEEFGKEVEYLWLPDVFGYSWALPQILKKSGIDMFMTTKISWNQYNRMPHDTFKWKGMDGTEVLTHFITTPEPWNEPGSWFYTYNGLLTAKTVKGVWDAYSEKEMNQELLISYGYGDGGGGVNRDLLERRRRIDKIPGLPSLETSTAGAFFRDLKKTVKNTDRFVHTWDGELYLEYHRGTYTSQGYNKRMNRKMELLYRTAEWLTAMGGVREGRLELAEQEKLTEGWKRILTNQFHDIIPGSSIHEVYEDARKDYETIKNIGKDVIRDYLEKSLEKDETSYTVYNASGWDTDEIAAVPQTALGVYTDGEGTVLTSQQGQGVTYVLVKNVPAMGYQRITFHPGQVEEKKEAFRIEGREIETPYYILNINEQGQIEKLYDKEYQRNVLAPKERGNVLQMFEDKPLDNDAWDIDIYYQQKMREVTDLKKWEIKEQGSLRLVIGLEWKYMNSTIEQEMILYSTNRRIDFSTHVDYRERQQLLKAAFPVDIRTTYATYDTQYGNVRRPNHWNTSWDQARFESVGHRFADLSERNYGVALLNDCKYGYDVKDNLLRISLLRSGKQPDHMQDIGEHVFTYSLLPHGGDFVEGGVVPSAFELNNPVLAVEGKEKTDAVSFFTLDNPEVEVDAVKKSEDGKYLVVRFHDFAGSRQKVTLKPGFAFSSWAEGDLRERRIEEPHTEEPVAMELHPYEIKTILFEL